MSSNLKRRSMLRRIRSWLRHHPVLDAFIIGTIVSIAITMLIITR